MMTLLKVCLFLIAAKSVVVLAKGGPDISVDSKFKECNSDNDPHMHSFSGFNFEFQNEGKYCMTKSANYLVEAQFKRQDPTVTLNCAVRIDLANTNYYAEIDNCYVFTSPLTISKVTFLNGQVVCSSVNAAFDPFDEAQWSSVTTGGLGFKCIDQIGYTWIKSELANPDDNVFVRIGTDMNSLAIVAPINATSTGCDCICDVDKDHDPKRAKRSSSQEQESNLITVLTDEQNESVNKYIEKCKNVLLGNVVTQLEEADLITDRSRARFEMLFRNCAIDYVISGGNIEFGSFQKDDIKNDICLIASNSDAGQKILNAFSDSVKIC